MEKDSGLIFSAGEIREKGGLTVSRKLDPGLVAGVLEAPAEVAKASADLVFSVGGGSILLDGAVRAALRLECARCGVLFTAEFSETFDELYEDAVESIDVSGALAESVALMPPLKPLCAPACKGLCAACGADLNLKVCGCPAGHGEGFKENGKENPFRALGEPVKKKRAK